MFCGKMKAVTFSYDDGVTQDRRLIKLLDTYGLKATFNLNSGLLGNADALVFEGMTVPHCKVRACEVRDLYKNHEIAVHTLTHPGLKNCTDEDVIAQVELDRLVLSELAGYEVVGMAYPCGDHVVDKRVEELVRTKTGVRYARCTTESKAFTFPISDLYHLLPSLYHLSPWEEMMQMADRFVAMEPTEAQLFYIWGHSYEFDIHDTWDMFEAFLQRIAGKDDIFYGTNREVFGL